MESRKTLIIIGGLIIAALIIGLYLFSGNRTANGGEKGGADGSGSSSRGGSKTHAFEELGLVPPDKALADYKAASVYPPDSMRLTIKNIDLLHPNKRYETLIPIEEGSEIYHLFSGDKYRVVGNESITFTLFAQRGNKEDKNKENIVISKAAVKKGHDPSSAKHIKDLTFTPAGSGEFTAEFNPSKEIPAAKTAGKYIASVKFEVLGEKISKDLQFEYFPESTIPARFTGSFTEELKDGSLVVNAEINVIKKGFYVFDANFFDSDGEPVAFAIKKIELPQGRSKIPFLVFGKVITDSGAKSPFVLRNLRGFRFIEVTTPDTELMDREIVPEYEKEYKTRGYSKNSFSNKEWDSEAKRRRMQFLEEQAGK